MDSAPALGVARDLFLYYIRDTFGRGFQVSEGDSPPTPRQAESLTPGEGVDAGESGAAGEESDGSSSPTPVSATDGEHTLCLDVRQLVESEDAGWHGRREILEELIADDIPARIALWVPAGADLPSGEPATSEFIHRVRQSATRLGPHERSHVPFPATLLMRKTQATGGVVSVTGGLNPHWARFTERVRGSYDLDSTAVHRLPESEDHLEALLTEIVEVSRTLEVSDLTRIETTDCWTIQRLSGDAGVSIVGVPPADTTDLGMAVRRNFRRIILDAAPGLRGATAEIRALVVTAPYGRIEQEGATTAMRGYDPGAYAGIDFVCLVTDGVVKPLIQPSPATPPWARVGA